MLVNVRVRTCIGDSFSFICHYFRLLFAHPKRTVAWSQHGWSEKNGQHQQQFQHKWNKLSNILLFTRWFSNAFILSVSLEDKSHSIIMIWFCATDFKMIWFMAVLALGLKLRANVITLCDFHSTSLASNRY